MTRIVALDPGLATFGLVAFDTDGTRHRCVAADVFSSKPYTHRLGHEMADDRVRRCRELQRWLAPHLREAAVVAAEAMSFPRGAHAITCISLAWGVLVSELEANALPLVTAFPTIWRKHLVRSGKEHAAHVEAVRRIPSFVPVARRIAPGALQVHALDALGVYAWSLSTNTVRASLR